MCQLGVLGYSAADIQVAESIPAAAAAADTASTAAAVTATEKWRQRVG
jgi:hypothetical protein